MERGRLAGLVDAIFPVPHVVCENRYPVAGDTVKPCAVDNAVRPFTVGLRFLAASRNHVIKPQQINPRAFRRALEVWLALDRERLPVKIRFTDKKGESFEQVATELGSP